MQGGGGGARFQPMRTDVHMEPKKLWRSNSIFNLCDTPFPELTYKFHVVTYRVAEFVVVVLVIGHNVSLQF